MLKTCIIINIKIAILFVLVGYCIQFYQYFAKPLSLPDLDTTKYWGPGDGHDYVEDTSIKPLKILYDRDTINALRRNLDRPLNLQNPLEGVGFKYGVNSKVMRPLIDYWHSIYLPKWDARQEYLNQFKHFMTQVNGLHIHFIRELPHDLPPEVGYIRIPLLLLHGWPGSIREFYEIIPKLVTYSDEHIYGFDVIAPSLVGFGFSSSASKPGFDTSEMAIVMRNLMLRLGYDRFIVHGGDWGSIIGSQMATMFPENVMGFHTNLCVMQSPMAIIKTLIASVYPPLFVPEKYVSYHFPIIEKFKWLLEESGYFFLQATKPDTIGIALASNPAGMAAYILEKFSTGTNSSHRELDDGGLFNMDIEMDAMLDNIMIYYLGEKIMSSMRFYAESMSDIQSKVNFDRIPTNVPMGCIRFKNDIPTPVDWALRDKYQNIIHTEYSEQGGHFAAMEVPDILYNDFVEFVKKMCAIIEC